MTESPACPACLETRRRPLGRKNSYEFHCCSACGSIVAQPEGRMMAVEEETIKSLYEHYYDQASFQTHVGATLSLDRLVHSSASYRKTGRWRDVGFGEGALLSAAAAQNWECFGVERSPQALEYGARRNWVVSAAPEGDERF